ncbi:hypothetical protein [Nostoc sp.]|uniref:hypothetical protein n=1 Tax=Nostoc sp. TaxID=1180 RepID=UPI002FF82DFD
MKMGWDDGKQQEAPLANRQKICLRIMYTLKLSNKRQEISKFQTANKLGGILNNYLAIISG